MENKELTELDRQLITTSRALMAASKQAVDTMGKGPIMMGNIFRYNRELLKQLGEVHFNVFFLKKSEFKCLIQISNQFFIYLSILDQFVVKIKRILYNFELILNKF